MSTRFLAIYLPLLFVGSAIGSLPNGFGGYLLIGFLPIYVVVCILILIVISTCGSEAAASEFLLAIILAPLSVIFVAGGISSYLDVLEKSASKRAETELSKITTIQVPLIPAGFNVIAIDGAFDQVYTSHFDCNAVCRFILSNSDQRVEVLDGNNKNRRYYSRSTDIDICTQPSQVETYLAFIGDGHPGLCAVASNTSEFPDAILLRHIRVQDVTELAAEQRSHLYKEILAIDERLAGQIRRIALIDQSITGAPNDEAVIAGVIGIAPRSTVMTDTEVIRLFELLVPYFDNKEIAKQARQAYTGMVKSAKLSLEARNTLLIRTLSARNSQIRHAALEAIDELKLASVIYSAIEVRNQPIKSDINELTEAAITALSAPDAEEFSQALRILTAPSLASEQNMRALAHFVVQHIDRLWRINPRFLDDMASFIAVTNGHPAPSDQLAAMALLTSANALHVGQLETSDSLVNLLISIVLAGEVDAIVMLKNAVLNSSTENVAPPISAYCNAANFIFSRRRLKHVQLSPSDLPRLVDTLGRQPVQAFEASALSVLSCFTGSSLKEAKMTAASAVFDAIAKKQAKDGLSSADVQSLDNLHRKIEFLASAAN